MPLWDLAKSEWDFLQWEAAHGPPPLNPGARELLLCRKSSISHQSRTGVTPLAVPGLGFCLGTPSPCSGLGVSASSIPSSITSLGRDRGPGGNRGSSWCFSLFQTLSLDGKSCGTSGWVGKLSRQRERSVSQNSGEFGPIPHFLPSLDSGSCTSKQVCVTTHNEPVLYAQRHPSCFPAGAFL